MTNNIAEKLCYKSSEIFNQIKLKPFVEVSDKVSYELETIEAYYFSN